MTRKILVVISDPHGGSRAGLLDPDTTLYAEDEQGNLKPWTPELTDSQVYLQELYTGGMDYVERLARGDEIMVIYNGDLCQGNKHAALLVSTRLADQPIIAERFCRRWLERDLAQHIRIAAGTEAHNFNQASAEILVQQLLQSRYPARDIQLVYHGLLTYNGLVIDYAHHGPHPGTRLWLKGNVARFNLKDMMLREITAGRRPPDLVLRGHFHEPLDVTERIRKYTSRLVLTPSFCMLDDHAIKATRSTAEITNGMIAFEIVDGHITRTHELYRTLDVRTKETL